MSGFIGLAGGMMLRGFFCALLCTLILIGKVHAQEVIVAREKKPESAKQTPQPSEEVTSESPTPAPHKAGPRHKKSAPATPTLEEMRAAGARAAEGLNDRSVSQPSKSRERDVESIPAPNPTVAETPRPVKKEAEVERRSTPHPPKQPGSDLEGIGPIRPTMMESGREPPSPSP